MMHEFTQTPASLRVQEILSYIEEAISRRENIQDFIELLDISKPGLFRCMRNDNAPVVAKALTLKVLNLCLTKYHFLSRSPVLISRPFGLIVDPCNSCNLACPGCVHSTHAREVKLFEWKPGLLSESRMDHFLRLYGPYAVQTMFYNYGEPLLSPHTPHLIRQAKRYLTQTVLSTHIGVPKFDPAEYVNSGLDFMILSIDGATQPVYERYRKNGDIETVFRNIHDLVEARRDLTKQAPAIYWQFLAFEHNVHEIPIAIEKARQLGVDIFSVVLPFDVSWDDPEIHAAAVQPQILYLNPDAGTILLKNWNPFPESIEERIIDLEFDSPWGERRHMRIEHDEFSTSPHSCHWLYKDIVMDAHGSIFPCSGSPQRGGHFVFRHIDDHTVDGRAGYLFNSERHRAARKFFSNGQKSDPTTTLEPGDPFCFKCDWYWNQVNADIDNMQAESYLQVASPGLFTDQSLRMLCSW